MTNIEAISAEMVAAGILVPICEYAGAYFAIAPDGALVAPALVDGLGISIAAFQAVITAHVRVPDKVADEVSFASQVRTTDATPTVLFRGPLAAGVGYIASIDVIGVAVAAPIDVCVIRASVAAKRVGAVAARIGAAVQLARHADAGASTWAASGDVVGTDFVVTVTGQSARTIQWSLRGQFYRFGPGGLT